MGQIERLVLVDNILWYASLVLPLVVGILAFAIARRRASPLKVCLLGAVMCFFLGAGGSFVAGSSILESMGGGSDIPWDAFVLAWHRMWYPIGIGTLAGIGLALYPFIKDTPLKLRSDSSGSLQYSVPSYSRLIPIAASVPDDGMQIHIAATEENEADPEQSARVYCLKFRSSIEGKITVLLGASTGEIEVPLTELERVIQIARKEVRSEAAFD